MMLSGRLAVATLLLAFSFVGPSAAADVCLLKLTINPKQSGFTGSGNVSAPTEATVSPTKLNATGHVFLKVPGTNCPPKLTTADAEKLLEQSSLELPIGGKSISFTPFDIKNSVKANEPDAPQLAKLDFLGLGIGLSGTEPLGPGSVKLGDGTAAEAKAAKQTVCSQMLLLNGTLDMSSALVGKRTSDVKHVAFNRTLGAGVSVKKTGDKLSNVTLYLSGVTLFLNVSPETTPGVEFSRALYSLTGDVVATADASDKANWQTVDADKVAWGTVQRKTAPVIIGGDRPPKPRYVGDKDSIAQQCKPSRVVDAATGAIKAAPATVEEASGSKKSAAGDRPGGVSGGALAVVLAVVAAAIAA